MVSVLLILTFKSLAVSFLTNRFNIQNFYMALSLFEWFVRLSGQTATFALYIINRVVFITVEENAYCAVWTDSLSLSHSLTRCGS